MASEPSHAMSDEELAAFQQASESYEAPITGPLVGQRQPSTALTSEYASADPVYQAKTQALPQKYSHYRTVRGDGKCGWRAVAFGYYEALIHHGDLNRFGMEEARLKSIAPLLIQAGFEPMMMEDFADAAYDLLREIANAAAEGLDALSLLLERFNDEMLQDYIITYLRSLTAAWMKTRETEWAPWLSNQSVDAYCRDEIMPVGAEMDNVALQALKDVLLSPAGIRLEVLYLDRSEGSEVTMHRFDPVAAGGFTLGSVRLLYRPGHYDILYKQEDLPAPTPAPAVVPTYLQYSSQPFYEPASDLNFSAMPDFMTLLPGMSYANQAPFCGGVPSSYDSYESASEFGFDTNSKAPVLSCTPTPSAPAPQSHVQSQPMCASASTPVQMVAPPSQLTHDIDVRTVPQLGHAEFGAGPFRPSRHTFDSAFMSGSQHFQTSIFRNSHYNNAHFNNPHFQPEQWNPDCEYATASSSSGGKSSRHKNSG
ncbi:Ubiquitin thioesterase [Sphaerulina musiva]